MSLSVSAIWLIDLLAIQKVSGIETVLKCIIMKIKFDYSIQLVSIALNVVQKPMYLINKLG